MATKEVDVTDSIVELQCPDFGRALPMYVHEGLLDGSSPYIINAIAAAKELQDHDNGKILVFVEIPHHAMAHFVQWLYTGRSGSMLDTFQTLVDALDLSKWTKDHLRNSDYRDQLVGEVIRLVTSDSTPYAPSQVMSAISNSFGDLDGGVARFLVDWIVRSPLIDTAICMQVANTMATGHAGDSIYREFTRAFLEIKMSGSAGTSVPWFDDPCRYHEHASNVPCFARVQIQPGLSVPRRAATAPTRKVKASAQRSTRGQQKKYEPSELLEYARPDEIFTTMTGDERRKVYAKLWHRMRKGTGVARGVSDTFGRKTRQDQNHDGKDASIGATANLSVCPSLKVQFLSTGDDAQPDDDDNAFIAFRRNDPSAREARAKARQLQKESLQTPPPTPD